MTRQAFRVYEHETIRLGERTHEGELIPTALDLDALARFSDANPRQRYFSVGWKSVTFTEWVGYLQVGEISFEILPKADRGTARGETGKWRRALMMMLRMTTGMHLRSTSEGAQHVDSASLLDLVASAFLDEVDQLVREGLARAYRSEEGNGTAFRGRLLVADNARVNAVRPDRFYVRFATFDSNTVVNQILAEATRCVRNLEVSDSVRARAAEHVLRFEGLSRLRVTPQHFDRLTLNRSSVRYEKAIRLARLILEGVAPALTYGRTSVVAFLFDMNVLWESFVALLFRRAAPPELEIETQTHMPFWKHDTGGSKVVKPDIVVRRKTTREAVLVVDTKWKVPPDGVPSDADLKQMFVYNELLDCSEAVLLYPSPHATAVSLRGAFMGTESRCCTSAHLGVFDAAEAPLGGLVEQATRILSRALGESS